MHYLNGLEQGHQNELNLSHQIYPVGETGRILIQGPKIKVTEETMRIKHTATVLIQPFLTMRKIKR